MALQHKHLIIRAETRRTPGRAAIDELNAWVRELVDSIGMNLLMGPYATYCDQPGNRGLTLVAIIETSHVAIHIWDETDPGLLQMDVYSCAEFDPALIFAAIDAQFDAGRIEYKFLDREASLREILVAC